MEIMILRDKKPRREAGFTMIELLVSIMILMVGIVAVAELVPKAIQSNFRSRNDSTALIAAQRLLEQMSAQQLNGIAFACAGAAPPGGHYAFCDGDNDGIAMGQINAGTTVTVDGCPVDATGQALDFSTAAPAGCNGYSVTKIVEWNPNEEPAAVTQTVELRWRVITWHNRGTPVRKVILVGARSGLLGQSNGGALGSAVRNLQTVVGRR